MTTRVMRHLTVGVISLLLILAFLLPATMADSRSAFAQACPPDAIARFGINVALEGGNLSEYPYEQLNLGWYMNYSYHRPASGTDLPYARMIRSHFNTSNLENSLGPEVDANPGVLWLAGNEPDRAGQDGITAEEYAVFYHDIYTFIKGRDPSAQIAFAGLVTPTVLRQKDLDLVLAEYNRLYGQNPPADVVHVHGFVMSEKMDASDGLSFWGAGVPPGMNPFDPDALRLEPQQHWDVSIFENNLRGFRQWMNANGYRNKPLIVSEYGILLPDAWDLNGVGTVNFMTSSFDFFLSETNGSTGYPSDGNRLTQQFSWFSLNFPDDTQQGALNGSLFIPNTSTLTAQGQAFKTYTENLISTCNIPTTNTPLPPTETPTPEPEDPPVEETPDPEETPVEETPDPEETPVEETPDPEETPVEETPDPEDPPAEETPDPEDPPVEETPDPEDPQNTPTPSGSTSIPEPTDAPPSATADDPMQPTPDATPDGQTQPTPGMTPDNHGQVTPEVTPDEQAQPGPTPTESTAAPTAGPDDPASPEPGTPEPVDPTDPDGTGAPSEQDEALPLTVSVTAVQAQVSALYKGAVVFLLTVSNNGEAISPSGELVNLVPQGTLFVQTSSSAGWSCPANVGANTECRIAVEPLRPNESRTYQFAVRLASASVQSGDEIMNMTRLLMDDASGDDVNGAQSASASVMIEAGVELYLPFVN